MRNLQAVSVLFLLATVSLTGIAGAQSCNSCDHDWAQRATPDTIQKMFENGTSPNVNSKFNRPLIFLVAMMSADPAVATKFLDEAKARNEELILVHDQDRGFVEATVLHYASRNKSPAMLRYFLGMGIDIDLRDARDKTPLHAAPGYSEDPETYALLLDAGVDPNATDVLGWTSLHSAARFSTNPEIFRLLVAHGANVNAKTDSGRTPLWIAENYRDQSIVNLLRSLGAE